MKPRQGKAFKIRVYHNYHEYHKYIYTYGKIKKRISKCNYSFLNNYIYLYYFLGMRYARTPKRRQGKALGRLPNA